MVFAGHKTRNVFDRYNIVSEQDLQEAAVKHQAYLLSKNGHNGQKKKPSGLGWPMSVSD